jgi:cephalosporin hydroxylase
MPSDPVFIRIQEFIYGVRPDVLIETGVARGGSLGKTVAAGPPVQ